MELRLNKLISDSGLCSRREADTFVEQGRVTVNGKLPEIGQKVTEQDVVIVDGFQLDMSDHTGAQKIRSMSGKTRNLMFGDKPLKREDLASHRENAGKDTTDRKPVEPKQSDRKPAGKKLADSKPSEKRVVNKSSADRKPTDRKPADHKSADHKSADHKPANRKPFDKKSALNKPVVRKSADWEDEDAVTFEKRPNKYVKYNKYAAARHAGRDGGKPKTGSASKDKTSEAQFRKEAVSPKFGKSLSRSAVAQRMGAASKSANLRKNSKNNSVNKAKRIDKRTKLKGE